MELVPLPMGSLARTKKSIFALGRKMNAVDTDQNGHAKSIRYKDKDVKAIMAYGYSKDQAVTALIQCDNNVPEAIQTLAES